VPRSPLALAALATVAVPGLDAYDVRRPAHPGTDFDIAVVVDAARRRWVVRAPVHATAGAALEAEVELLNALGSASDAGVLPCAVPRPVGFAHLPEGGRAAVPAEIPGRSLDVAELVPGPGLCASLGRAIAAVHELPTSVVENAGLPVYDAEAYRARRQAEVDEAARTGKVPPTLLRRWEDRLEDVSLWRFRPTVVHGDLTNERILVRDGEVSGILHWGDACVADPADDLSWLLVAAPPEAADSILEAYQLRRTELLDPHLTDRALLAGELALARWLLYGVRTDNDDVVADAVEMLVELDEHTRPTWDDDARTAPIATVAASSVA
jgi:macrolide phosphotransferase